LLHFFCLFPLPHLTLLRWAICFASSPVSLSHINWYYNLNSPNSQTSDNSCREWPAQESPSSLASFAPRFRGCVGEDRKLVADVWMEQDRWQRQRKLGLNPFMIRRQPLWCWERTFKVFITAFGTTHVKDVTKKESTLVLILSMGVRQGVAMDSLKFHPGPPSSILLRPVGGPPLKRPFQEWPVRRAGGLRPILRSVFNF
jgi:hypothetical protein